MKPIKHFKVLAFIACLLISSMVLTSCAAIAPANSTQAATTTPKYGGTLKIAVPGLPTSFDAYAVGPSGSAAYAIVKTYSPPLMHFAGANDREATMLPYLINSYNISEDGYTYTFHLKEGIKWQNIPPVNGREFVAEDMKYIMDRIIEPANKVASRTIIDMKSTEVVDKYTLKVITNSKSPGWLAYIWGIMPYAKEVVEAPGGAAKNWVGTGAFIFKEYKTDSKAVMVRNPDYFEKGYPYVDKVEFYFMPDASTRLAAFRAGEIDILPRENKYNRDNIARTVPSAQIHEGVGMTERGLLMNGKKTPFENKKVRQAIQYAIDYDGLIKSSLDGAGIRTGYLAPMFAEYGAKQVTDLPKRDLAKAKALLAEAGYPNGFKTTILQNTSDMDMTGNAIEPLVAMLKEIGIDVTIVQADSAAFLNKWRSGDFDLTIWNCMTARPFDPDNSLRQQWMTKAAYNTYGYSNAEVDRLITEQQQAFPDKAKRIEIIKKVLTILEDDVPAIPLYIVNNYYIHQAWIKGINDVADPHITYATYNLPYAWIDK